MQRPFGELLREIREKRGLSVNQLGMYSEVSPSLISKLENGERAIPKPQTLEKLAKGLKIKYEELAELAGLFPNQKEHVEEDHILSESELDRLVSEAEKLYGVSLRDDEDVHDAVRQVLHSLAKMKKK